TSSSRDSTESEENSGEEDEADEMLDPRVKVELENLNSATTEINDLEQELEEMHAVFRQTLSESAFVLKTQSNMLGKCVEQSRPYYKKSESAKQIMDSELEKQQSEREHLDTAQRLTGANKAVSEMKTKLKSAISKSRVYFDLRDKYMDLLEKHKQRILSLQHRLKNSKQNYSSSLRALETISDEIHELRKSQLDLTGPRQDGVGAECPSSPLEGSKYTDESYSQPDETSIKGIDNNEIVESISN
ncbi:hypothetical protein QZH41_014119, partial [Actinostola sp. cb2023]